MISHPAVFIQPLSSQVLSGFNIRLQVFVNVLPGITYLGWRASQILMLCWQHQRLAGAAVLHHRQACTWYVLETGRISSRRGL